MVDPDVRNPFSSLLRRVAGQKKKTDPREKKLRPITREEAESLLTYIAANSALKYQLEMFVTVRLLWVTGCRLNEICGRYLSDIDDRGEYICINIPESKTEAGKRSVMIVGDDDCALLRKAMKKAAIVEPSCPENEGRLFPRINLGGYDKQPSHYLGKALEKARKNLEADNSKWDMHSFRRTAVSALVNAGVAREARNLAVGHSNKDDIGISVYAKRAELDDVILSTFKALYGELGGSLVSPPVRPKAN
ncbi:tyrosine-type recombinase/integrase [Ruegeria arenilitoris]|uniref:tyrosine-type recombinase/integrase n=1 Tax=Ruegeria arenilitoris TaxID=1173585 RepID=UPI00147DEF46|nr:tyrosine-type recombinase/integrase [Ruegeria arenilitoris]